MRPVGSGRDRLVGVDGVVLTIKARLRRFLSGPIPIRAATAATIDLAPFRTWLAGFDPHVVAACEQWLAPSAPDTWVVMPEERLAAFRTDATASLRAVRETLRGIASSSTPACRVIWALDNRDGLGLSRVEAEAVFGESMAIDLLEEAQAAGRSRLLIAGRLREDLVLVALRLDAEAGDSALLSALTLEWLSSPLASGVRVLLFIDHPTALALTRRPQSLLARCVRALVDADIIRLALWVPRGRTESALGDPAREVAPLRLLAPFAVHHVRFESTDAVAAPRRIWKVLAAAGLSVDSSMTSAPAPSRADSAHPTSYVRGGAYWPQPFDLTTPAAVGRENVPLEVIAVPVTRNDAGRVWRWRARIDDDRLRKLIDFDRVNAYGRDLAQDLRGAQQYHEYRVYNWPPPAPSPRVTLLDAGTTARPVAVARMLGWCRAQAARSGRSWRLAAHDAFYDAARCEADARIPATDAAARRQQIASHGYLESDPSTPLREDAVEFTRFLPATLGATLELGSGYGHFARALADRATTYICLELDPEVVRRAASRPPLRGLAGDIHALPFRNASFASVIANNVLEHAYDPIGALSEIRRVLTDDGRLFAFIPLDALNADYELPAHYWKADESNIARAFAMGGLRVVRSSLANLYTLGVRGAFPSCDGLTCEIEAAKSSCAEVAS